MAPRKPVRIEATAITTVTPMTMPSTVRKLRSLFARTMLNAIAMVSVGMIDVIFIRLVNVAAVGAVREGVDIATTPSLTAPTAATPQFLVSATIGSSRDALYAG